MAAKSDSQADDRCQTHFFTYSLRYSVVIPLFTYVIYRLLTFDQPPASPPQGFTGQDMNWSNVFQAYQELTAHRQEYGSSISVYHDGRLVADLHAGWADPEAKQRRDEKTLTRMGSLSNFFSATMLTLAIGSCTKGAISPQYRLPLADDTPLCRTMEGQPAASNMYGCDVKLSAISSKLAPFDRLTIQDVLTRSGVPCDVTKKIDARTMSTMSRNGSLFDYFVNAMVFQSGEHASINCIDSPLYDVFMEGLYYELTGGRDMIDDLHSFILPAFKIHNDAFIAGLPNDQYYRVARLMSNKMGWRHWIFLPAQRCFSAVSRTVVYALMSLFGVGSERRNMQFDVPWSKDNIEELNSIKWRSMRLMHNSYATTSALALIYDRLMGDIAGLYRHAREKTDVRFNEAITVELRKYGMFEAPFVNRMGAIMLKKRLNADDDEEVTLLTFVGDGGQVLSHVPELGVTWSYLTNFPTLSYLSDANYHVLENSILNVASRLRRL